MTETIKGFQDETLRSVWKSCMEKFPQDYVVQLTAFVSLQQELAVRDYKEEVSNFIEEIEKFLISLAYQKDNERVMPQKIDHMKVWNKLEEKKKELGL